MSAQAILPFKVSVQETTQQSVPPFKVTRNPEVIRSFGAKEEAEAYCNEVKDKYHYPEKRLDVLSAVVILYSGDKTVTSSSYSF